MANYFKLTTSSTTDYNQLMWLLKNKIFFPTSSSNPALPAFTTTTYTNIGPTSTFKVPSNTSINTLFDYRQFFKYIGNDIDGMPIVKTRQDWTVNDFNSTKVVLSTDWVNKYGLLVAPTVSIYNYNEIMGNGSSNITTSDVWLSYQYPNNIY